MGVGGDEGGICYVGPPAEAEPTVAEGSKGEGGADGVEGVGERRESADDAEQGSVIGGLGAVEGWTATIDAAKEVGDAVLEGLESKDVLDMKAGAKPDGGEVGSDGRSCVGGKANFEVGGADGAAKDADAVKVDFFVGDDGREKFSPSHMLGANIREQATHLPGSGLRKRTNITTKANMNYATKLPDGEPRLPRTNI